MKDFVRASVVGGRVICAGKMPCPELLLESTWTNSSGDKPPFIKRSLCKPIHCRADPSPKGHFPCTLPMPNTCSYNAWLLQNLPALFPSSFLGSTLLKAAMTSRCMRAGNHSRDCSAWLPGFGMAAGMGEGGQWEDAWDVFCFRKSLPVLGLWAQTGWGYCQAFLEPLWQHQSHNRILHS